MYTKGMTKKLMEKGHLGHQGRDETIIFRSAPSVIIYHIKKSKHCNVPEDFNHHHHHYENQKSHMSNINTFRSAA